MNFDLRPFLLLAVVFAAGWFVVLQLTGSMAARAATTVTGAFQEEAGAEKREWTRPADQEIKDRLSPLQFDVTQNDATELPFDNEYWDNKESGIYVDVVSGEPLFVSSAKYDSGTGWPSFTRPIESENIVERSKRLIEQQHVRLRHQCARQRDTHAHSSGQHGRTLRKIPRLQTNKFEHIRKLPARGYNSLKLEGQAHVGNHTSPGQECRFLKDEGNPRRVFRIAGFTVSRIQRKRSGGGFQQARDEPQ